MAARHRHQTQQGLPEEYRELFPREQLQPEQKLMLAVLEDAFARFQRSLIVDDEPGKGAFEDVESWFMSDDDPHLYSLETICINFDIDVNCLRQRLMEWKSSVAIERRQTHAPDRVERLEFLLHSRKRGGL